MYHLSLPLLGMGEVNIPDVFDNGDYKRIITDYFGSSKTITTSSDMATSTTTSTTYKLTWTPVYGTMQGELQLASSASTVDGYYNNWEITVDVSGAISTGTITDYVGNSRTITATFSPSITTTSSTVYSLIDPNAIPATVKVSAINSSGEITAVSILDGGQGYIPGTTTINLSSQNKLQWTPAAAATHLISHGLETITGTCTQADDGWISNSEPGGIYITPTTALSDGTYGDLDWIIELSNPSYVSHIYSYTHSTGRIHPWNKHLTAETPATTTSTTYKLTRYHYGIYAGAGSSNSSQVELDTQTSSNANTGVIAPSSVDDYFKGWVMFTYADGLSTNDPWMGIITSYNGTTKIAQVQMKNSSGSTHNNNNDVYVLTPIRNFSGTITAGDGLSGGGITSRNISVNFDLSTHDNTTSTSSYTTNNTTDKILLYQTSSSKSKLPTMTNFLSSISGTGITSSDSGLNIQTTQTINQLSTDYLKIRGSSGNDESLYLNIGKDDTNNLNILPKYTSNKLSSVVIKSDTSNSSDNAKVQFDIGDNDNILDIHNSGISVKSGLVTSLTIANGGTGYSTAPVLTFETSPMGSSYTATATCTISSDLIKNIYNSLSLYLLEKGICIFRRNY